MSRRALWERSDYLSAGASSHKVGIGECFCVPCTQKPPERASAKKPSGNQTGFLEARSRVYVFRVPSIALQEERLVGISAQKTNISPPPNSQIRYRNPPGPSAPPLLETPPPRGFSMNNRPPPPFGASDSPFRLPEQKEMKNIRNIHQERFCCNRPRPTQGLPGPFGPGTPEESEKSPERVPRGWAPKVPKECAPESRKSLKRVQKSDFRLFSDSFETPGRTLWALLGPCPGGCSFRTLFRLFRGSGPEGHNSCMPFRRFTWNEYYTNERQSRDSNRSATNAGSTRTKFCVF